MSLTYSITGTRPNDHERRRHFLFSSLHFVGTLQNNYNIKVPPIYTGNISPVYQSSHLVFFDIILALALAGHISAFLV
jgi:hypothetical protein